MEHGSNRNELLNMDLAREMVDSFVCSTGVSCLLSDEQGRQLYRREPEHALYAECCALMGDQACQELHLFGAGESERLGGRYFYFCPMGMGCIAAPIVLGGKRAGSLTAGPVRVMDVEDHMESTPVLHQLPEGEKRSAVTELLEQFPRRKPGDLGHLSVLLLSTALYIGGESRTLLEQRQILAQGAQAEAGGLRQERKAAYPLDKEQAVLRAIREGDLIEARALLDDLMGYLLFALSGDFAALRTRAVELMTLFSRAAVDGGADLQQVLELNQQFLKELDYLPTAEELPAWMGKVVERYTALVFDAVDVRHKDVIYKAVNYIKRNFSGRLTLEDVARHVGFSPAYFSKVFKDEMGMTFNKYLGSLRVERSKKLLLFSALPMDGICAAVGFEDQSYFTKVFRRYTGITPGKFRKQQGWLDVAVPQEPAGERLLQG